MSDVKSVTDTVEPTVKIENLLSLLTKGSNKMNSEHNNNMSHDVVIKGSRGLFCRKYYGRRTVMVKSKIRNFFTWTDDEVDY